MLNYYSMEELKEIGFNSIGENVKISRKTSIYDANKMSIGNNVRIDDFCILSGNIQIGSNIHIAPFCGLYGGAGIEIHDFVGLSSRVSIYSVSDDYSGEFLTNPTIDDKFRNVRAGKVILERHSLIGASSVVLPSVTIKEGTSIGAMSLITKDTESWHIYIGTFPAKKVSERSKELLKKEEEFLNSK